MTEETEKPEIIEAELRETEEKKRFRRLVKIFSILVICVLIISVTIATISENKEASELAAWNKILNATFVAQTSDKDLTKELNSILDQGAGSTNAGFYAQMLILENTGISYEQSKLKEAKKAGTAFINNYPENKFIDQVKVDLATVLFNLKDFQGALKLYNEVCNSQTSYLQGEANLFKALTQEKLGKESDAIQTYTFISSESNDFLGSIKEYALFAKSQLVIKKD